MFFHKSLEKLGVTAYSFEGETPTSAREFRKGFRLLVDGEEVKPETMPVTWAKVAAQMDAIAAEEGSRAKRAAIDVERARRLEAGASFTVTWSAAPVPITGRPFDQTVILGLLTRASAYKSAGVTAPILTYRDAANTVHKLTPDQFIELATAAMNWVEAVMKASWTLKDGASIPADYAADAHWP